VSTGELTAQARKFALDHNVRLVEGPALAVQFR
jgi:hypothetical protein